MEVPKDTRDDLESTQMFASLQIFKQNPHSFGVSRQRHSLTRITIIPSHVLTALGQRHARNGSSTKIFLASPIRDGVLNSRSGFVRLALSSIVFHYPFPIMKHVVGIPALLSRPRRFPMATAKCMSVVHCASGRADLIARQLHI